MLDKYIVAVDGKAVDVRETADLAVRQAKMRKAAQPSARVEIHYGEATTKTYHDGKQLVVDVIAPITESTCIATVCK